MEHPLKVVGACERCVKRSARYSVTDFGTTEELCHPCLTSLAERPQKVTQLYAGVPPEDVRNAYTLTDEASAWLDRLRRNYRIQAIALYEVMEDGGAQLSVQATGSSSHHIDLNLYPNGRTDF